MLLPTNRYVKSLFNNTKKQSLFSKQYLEIIKGWQCYTILQSWEEPYMKIFQTRQDSSKYWDIVT